MNNSDRISNPALTIPTLAQMSPDFAGLEQRASALDEERQRLELERDQISARMAQLQANPEAASSSNLKMLLAGRSPIAAESEETARLREIGERLAEIATVRRLLDGHRRTVCYDASTKLCDQIRPQYRQLVRAMCEAVIALHRAWADYDVMTLRLTAGNVAWAQLVAMTPKFAGNQPLGSRSALAEYLLDAVKFGFIDRADLPPELMFSASEIDNYRASVLRGAPNKDEPAARGASLLSRVTGRK